MDYKEYFLSKYPEEGVGYIKKGVFYPCENLAEDKIHSFEIDSSILLKKPDVIIHSHTITSGYRGDPHEPSREDLAGQIATDCEWAICVTDGQVCEDPLYWGNPKNRPPLLERQFIHNIQDCFCLVQDWYYAERKIILPNLPRDPHWYETENHIEDKYAEWGFEETDGKDMKVGDLILFKVRSPVANHLGVYVGDGKMMTHWLNRLSEVQTIGLWKDYITKVLRYRDEK